MPRAGVVPFGQDARRHRGAECGPLRCIGYHELVGKTVQLSLPIRVNGNDSIYQWTLRITEAIKSVRGGRPPGSAAAV